MVNGAHIVVYSSNPEADRAFFRDVLGYAHVDAGGGWLIFTLPPAEIAVHPSDGRNSYGFYLICDDVDASVDELTAKGVEFTKPVTNLRWGRSTAFRLPGGGEVGLYEPSQRRAIAP